MAARTRKQAKRDVTLLEAAASAGAVAGLLVPVAGHAGRRCPVRAPSCLGQTLVNAAEPYVMHTLAGALVAAAVALVALLAWRHRGVAPPAGRLARQSIPARVRHEVWRRDQGRCVECGSRGRLEFDHIIPFSKGGSSTARNLELRCEPCNRRKGARI